MKTFILSNNSIVSAKGFTPQDAVAIVPDTFTQEDYPFLYAEQELNEETQELAFVVKLNQAAKDQAAIDAQALAEENKWTELRSERNRKLTACDYTQLQDCPLTVEQIAAWSSYRQQLRDLPETVLDINNVIWPTIPGAE